MYIPCVLVVQQLSIFLQGDSNRVTFYDGENVNLNCISHTFINTKIVWIRNTQILNNIPNLRITESPPTSNLTITSFNRLHIGNYFCCINVSEGIFCSESIQLKLNGEHEV